ncbi:MAG: TonB-dependent receptor [Saprospiraceae bacterium]
MKKLILSVTLLLFFSLASDLMAQATSITGTVTDNRGEVLIGATVSVKESPDVGTVTNIDGSYDLRVNQAPPFTLVVSYTGFSDTEQTVETAGQVDFVLSVDALGLDEVIVTGVANNKSKLESSVSITTLKPEGILQSSPRTTAEIFRTIPGIRSESSGGDGNTNIAVRGIPISAGGSKYLQLQEDGLPVFMFGDIAFATSDIFLRADQTVGRIEAIRGGSASTLATNSPAGIINFISKTGAVEGGSFGSTFGLDYNSFRSDFEYGAPIGDNGLNFHVGGFFRTGEGPRTTGYNGNNGGQVKANLTKNFKNGYARVYLKHLNDRTTAYMPMPIAVSGTNDDPTWESIDGFSATQGTPHSVHLLTNFGIGADGERRNADVTDGMRALSNSIGAEFSFDLGNGWSVESRSRYSDNSGRFVAPFPSAAGTTDAMLGTIAGAIGDTTGLAGATLTYADGEKEEFRGELAQVIHMFDTELKDFNTLFSDTKVSKTINDNITVSAGYFKGQQNINMAWLWNSYFMEIKGEDARLIDITNSEGTALSENGKFAYGVPVWGNCCQQLYDTKYDVSAPYAQVAIELNDNLNIDASMRWDFGRVSGSSSGGTQGTVDVNNDGVISSIEQSVSVINNARPAAVQYDYDYPSFFVFSNYKLNNNQAVFGRFSQGGSSKADRIIAPGSSTLFVGNPKDIITQGELGWKQKFKTGGLFITAFYAGTTEEGGFEATTQTVIENDYTALGVEVEGAFDFGDFDVRGALTYTNAEISSGDNEGNKPRRQPDLMFNLIPSYSLKGHSIGLSLIGQSDAFAQDNNELVMPGYVSVNAFINVAVYKGLTVSLNANNLFDTIGITESEEGAITEGQVNYVRARSITGRSISGTVRYSF